MVTSTFSKIESLNATRHPLHFFPLTAEFPTNTATNSHLFLNNASILICFLSQDNLEPTKF